MPHLPLPPLAAVAHSQRLAQRLRHAIQSRHGWLSFAEFMQHALYEPQLGYYVCGSQKLGATGDFVTAPEISGAFSECLALQCQQIFNQLPASSILEFGAGSGVMAADILLVLEKKQQLPQHYYILEVSPDLQQRQWHTLQQKCPHLLSRITWINALPKDFVGVVLANEVLDAMPVHCFEIIADIALEKGVTFSQGQFKWQLNPNRVIAKKDMPACLSALPADQEFSLPSGYTSEICYALKPWLQALYATVQRGVVLLLDYGFPEREYYHPDRAQGTLMCHYRHHAHTDPFFYVGLQDITAHVDFTAVARAANQAGFIVAGYTNQAPFLMALDILTQPTLTTTQSTAEHYRQVQALKKLLLPSEMGELFKVMALSKKMDLILQGFQLKNDIQRLQ